VLPVQQEDVHGTYDKVARLGEVRWSMHTCGCLTHACCQTPQVTLLFTSSQKLATGITTYQSRLLQVVNDIMAPVPLTREQQVRCR